MRLFFLLLIFLNISFYYWQFSLNNTASSLSPPAPVNNTDIPSLTLLSESTSIIPSQQTAKKGQVQASCYTVGPFIDKKIATTTATQLLKQDLKTAQRVAITQHLTGYWVVLNRETDLAEARLLITELKGKGLSDVTIVPVGNKRYAISLGFYSRPDTMNSRKRALTMLGYDVNVEERYRNKTHYWLDLLNSPSSKAIAQAVNTLKTSTPDITQQRINCNRKNDNTQTTDSPTL